MFITQSKSLTYKNGTNMKTVNPYPESEKARLGQLEVLLSETKEYTMDFMSSLDSRKVYPSETALKNLKKFIEPMPEEYSSPFDVIGMLHKYGSPAAVASAGRRYFGFVIGGCQPVSLAANWLAGAWDQNAGLGVTSPVSAAIEDIVSSWLSDLLPVSKNSVAGFVSGVTVANLCGIAAARHHILSKHNWNVQDSGLFGAPEIKVVVGEQAHGSMLKALSLLGLGRKRVITVPVDAEGKMIADAFPDVDQDTIVCLQAGNVNSGSFDPAKLIIPKAKASGAWVHVDGAFGLWAGVTEKYSHLTDGYELADSWATDGHKWLNVPYDSGIIICRHTEDLKTAMSMSGEYLDQSGPRVPYQFTPELSRRARGVEIWAALKTLGKKGISDLIERTCSHAQLFASKLSDAGFEILNDVVINQVLVAFGDKHQTEQIIKAVQYDGTCWCSGTTWHGRSAMRISISSWATTEEDVIKSAEAMIRAAGQVNRG